MTKLLQVWRRPDPHARPPAPCPDCRTTIHPASLARHRLTLTCAIEARTWALAAQGFHAYARYGPPGWWRTRSIANTIAPWWPPDHRVLDIARVVRHDYHGSSPQAQWFLRSPVPGVDVTVLLHEIANIAKLESPHVDGDLVARVLARDPATLRLAHTKPFTFWPETDSRPEPPSPADEPAETRILKYDDALDAVELEVACDGSRHRLNLSAGGATFPDHRRPPKDSACGRLAAGTRLKEFRSMEPLLQARWLELAFAPLDALRWTRLVSSLPTEAALWRDSGLSITQARWFRASPYEPHEARQRLHEGLIS